MGIIVRKALPNEFSTITEFQIMMALETENIHLDKDTVTKGVKAVFNDSSKGQYWVAEVDSKVISSMLMTSEWSDWRNKTVLWFQSVYVIPEYRKQGVFAEMYNYIKAYVLKSENYAGLRLYVDKTNTGAQNVYEKLGMSAEHYKYFEWMKEF